MTQQLYGFIADGYTLDHCIPASGYHPEVNIKFRPATQVERSISANAVVELQKVGRYAEAERRAAEFDVKKLVSWDLVAPPITEGALPMPVEISVENILRLEPHLSGALYDVLLGNIPAVAKEIEDSEKNCGAGCS